MNSPKYLSILIATAALLSPVAQSATVTWSAPQQITGDSDVSTTGTLIGAFNAGAPGVTSTTVNGVDFQSFATTGGNGSSGNFMTVGSGFVGQTNTATSANTPYSALSAAYRSLLASYATPFGGTIAMTISGLIIGAQYQFQFWSNESSGSFGYQITASAGNSVTLRGNTGSAPGGLGQWVIGSFTADAVTQMITFAGDGDGGELNGFQLRNVTPRLPSVPDSGSTLAFLSLAMSGLSYAGRRLRARA